MKKCGSRTVILYVAVLVLFFVSQIKFSSITELFAVISTRMRDQGTTSLVLSDRYSRENPAPALASPIICNRSHLNYDICSINSPTVLDPKASTFYVTGHTISKPQVEKIQPYPRKWDKFRMNRIKEFNLTSGPPSPPCMVQHNATALVFSVGGYDGDFFSDFYDEFIPLFITINSLFYGKDFVLVISNVRGWWIWRYADLLQSFNKHPIINLDNDTTTHCFPSATIGLMSLDLKSKNPKPTTNSKIILQFHQLLEKTYGHNHSSNSPSLKTQPRLVLAGRRGAIGRLFMHRAEVKKVAEDEGFEVVEFDPKYAIPMHEVYALLSSSHVLMGVHGAALTHLLFLRPGSVLLQVVPLATEWLAERCFGILAREMDLDYMDYKIGVGESSLVDKYGKDHMALKDPEGFLEKNRGWTSMTVETYLKKQNVRLDLDRFRGYLKKAFVKAKAFMDREG
ncbi:Protein O-linked-mannose beta-1,4-N-acetylglucosaminyltransferase [Actinidia chinensis var. chinensis]|uniref:Protein O-linked-mannose beta-1,4-N-acetylglucosaminyltransferase n=1 Tax=Actinidia chinensis var. chinensis TaxID=1590841 RepID=A0A2R6PBT3_ACTCC|nr:Protein O-linked-mannose beta-1,4-N-acetylglucosaminyltransferase [Actinidia chinensis var. chinensis]